MRAIAANDKEKNNKNTDYSPAHKLRICADNCPSAGGATAGQGDRHRHGLQ